MSKRAEIAALKVYPPTHTIVKRHTKRVQSELVDTHQPVRAIFQRGYEQAEKDTIEKAIKWLRDRVNIPYDVETNEDGEPLADSYIEYAKKRIEAANEIVDDFRKAMEE